MNQGSVQRFGKHKNSFGFLRLLFASLVIVAHTPVLADGNRNREIFYMIFGTIQFGELAVDGFFIISGYLILGSFLNDPHVKPYLIKRCVRIYPAFILAFLLSVLVAGPLGGALISELWHKAPDLLFRLVLLKEPDTIGAFAGSPHPSLNGSMWTISYEFRCYLFILILGRMGAWRSPPLIAAMVIFLLVGFKFCPTIILRKIDALPLADVWIGDARQALRLTGIFLTGSLFYLWRDHIRITFTAAMFATVGLCACLFIPRLAEPAIAVFGGYIIFAFAGCQRYEIFNRINNKNDISYGVYLYAWPIEKIILWNYGKTRLSPIDLIALGCLTFVLSCAFGILSWHLLEKPLLSWLRRRTLVRKNHDSDLIISPGASEGGYLAAP